MKRNKYGAKATKDPEGGQGYPSKLEAAVGAFLELRQKNGEISELRRQHPVTLQDGPPNQKITWKIDFSFIENGDLKFAEAKGYPDEVYKIKLKLFRGQRTE